ncbi:uncharacterized protein LOC132927716 isoform X2 [Rhopalosiphum padi]|uniref:uncharacterized protein LOC132927716 isoform X2 n=1 Tax=Rhopalosiphum padi TaxID=40932 RepID=UPI00298E7938|nr:uncharacterized protein LOC132927716 isoform X2 [Rhopalosiphum padi]
MVNYRYMLVFLFYFYFITGTVSGRNTNFDDTNNMVSSGLMTRSVNQKYENVNDYKDLVESRDESKLHGFAKDYIHAYNNQGILISSYTTPNYYCWEKGMEGTEINDIHNSSWFTCFV